MYSEGQDILGSTYEWTGSDSLTYGFKTVSFTNAGKYFIRFDRLSGNYALVLKITINSIVQIYNWDSMVGKSDGISVVPLSVSAGCTLQITYTDVSGYPIAVHSTSTDMTDISTASVANTTGDTTKTLTVSSLNTSLTWYLVVHHGLTTATDIEEFSVVLETDSSSPCTNNCQATFDIYSVSYPELDDGCGCLKGSLYVSDYTNGDHCEAQCGLVEGSSGSDGNNGCLCSSGGLWD